MAKRPIPGRPTVAAGVPNPVSWGGPSQSLSKMATSIGANRALSEFYKVMVESQLEYDEDEHEFGLSRLTDNRRHRQTIDVQDHREYLKGDKGSGLGNKSYASIASGEKESETEEVADSIMEKNEDGSTAILGSIGNMLASASKNDPDATHVETTVEKKKAEAAAKKALADEEEKDWWGKAMSWTGDKVTDPFQDGGVNLGVPKFVEDAGKATGGGIADAAGWAADTKIGGAVTDVGKSAFKQLSRPLHGTANAADAWFDLDKEEGNTPEWLKKTNFFTGGQAPIESLDDLSLGGIGDVFKAFGEGFSLNEKKTYSDVLRANAERDTEHNMYDSLTYQTVMGTGEDVILDPLNLIGVGLVTKPIKAVREARNLGKIQEIADEVTKLGVQRPKGPAGALGPDIPLSVDEVVGMLSPGKYKTKAQRIQDSKRLTLNAQDLSSAVGQARPVVSSARGRAIEAKALELQEQIKSVTSKHGSSVAIDELVRDIHRAEENGVAPKGSVDKFYTELDAAKVNRAFKSTWSTKGDKQKAFDDALGDDWKNNPALTEADRKALWDDFYKNAKNNPEFKDLMGHNQAALTEKTKAEAHLALMQKRGRPADIAEAQVSLAKAKADLKKLQKDVTAAKIQSFQQAAMARAMKNLGKPLYKDPERASQLQAIMDTIEGKLLGIGRGVGGEGTSPTIPLKHGEARGPEHDIDPNFATPNTGAAYDGRTPEASDDYFDPDLDNIDSVLSASPDSFNYESQLQAAYTKADKELKDLTEDYAPVGKDSIEIPPQLLRTDGELNEGLFFDNLRLAEDDALKWEAPPSNDPAITKWTQDAVERLNRYTRAEFTRLRNNAMRRSNEESLKEATSEVTMQDIDNLVAQGDPRATKLKSMFSAPPKGTKTTKADANLYPHIEFDGKKVHETEAENLPGRVDAELSETYTDWVKNPEKMSEEDTEHLASLLGSIGLSVGNSPEGIYRYVLGHKDALLDAVSPAKLAFAQEFKKQHGMTLQEAKDLRAGLTGNSVGMALDDADRVSKWQVAHPYGVSEPTFVREVMSAVDEDSLLKILDGSPISVTIPRYINAGKSAAHRNYSFASKPGSKGQGWKRLFADADSKDKKSVDVKLAQRRLNEALKEAGLPKTATLDDVRSAWAHDILKYLEDSQPAKLREDLKKNWRNRFDASKKRNADAITAKARAKAGSLDAKTSEELRVKARWEARQKFVRQANEGSLLTKNSDRMLIPHAIETPRETVGRVAEVKKAEIDGNITTLREELVVAKAEHNNVDVKAIEGQIADLRKEWDLEKTKFDAAVKAAHESQRTLQKRIQEEALLSIANATIQGERKSLNLNVAGKAINIKGSAQMFAAAEKAAGLPVLKQFATVYREAFASQRNLLPDDMQVIANRALSNPSEVIGYHVRDIKKNLGQIPYRQRRAVLRGMLKGTNAGSGDDRAAIMGYMDKLLPYFQGKAPVGGKEEYISLFEINRFLPDKFKFETRGINHKKIDHSFHLLKELAANAKRNGHKVDDLDPVEIVWATRIATEQAMARHALAHATSEMFGVKRIAQVDFKGNPTRLSSSSDAAQAVEKLKAHGWESLKEFNHTHLFPPESVQDIKRMMDMFEPRNITPAGKFIDEVTGMWKTTVTIYNIPGYYVRNGIGEAMSAWLGGVTSPTPFRKAHNVIRFYKNEGAEVEALRDHMPALAHMMKGETTSELGKKHAVTLQNGQELNTERVAVLYRDQGLSSGFINTEYNHHYSKAKENLKKIPGAKFASKKNDQLRAANENYEDFYRLGHFIDKLGKAPKGMSEQAASEWAAKEVRKYHFDYTDFTKAEKTVMLRAFPFYKWTRKALPLMSSMLFVKPGKMMAYPKIASGASEGLMASEDFDPTANEGFMPGYNPHTPNFEGITPAFVNDLWAYQVGEAQMNDEGKIMAEYGRIATPQLDSMNMASNPLGGAWQLLNPMIKEPAELISGQTLGNMSLPIENNQDRVDSIAGNTPQTALLNNVFKKMGLYDEEGAESVLNKDDLIRLMTGMGYYDAGGYPQPKE